MSRGMAFKAVASTVLVMFLASTVLAEGAGMLEPTGNVMVNESQVTRVSAVFAGDRVKTGNDSGAMVSGKGATVQLASNSAMTMGARSVALDQGAAAMTLSPTGSAQVGDLTLTPSGGAAAYEVSREPGTTQIKVTSGNLLVARAGVITPLSAGTQYMFQNGDPQNTPTGNAGHNRNVRTAIAGAAIGVAAGLIVWFTVGETSHIVP
jgi:hypothetical protein